MLKKAAGMFTSAMYQLCLSTNVDAFIFIVEVFQLRYTMYLPNSFRTELKSAFHT